MGTMTMSPGSQNGNKIGTDTSVTIITIITSTTIGTPTLRKSPNL